MGEGCKQGFQKSVVNILGDNSHSHAPSESGHHECLLLGTCCCPGNPQEHQHHVLFPQTPRSNPKSEKINQHRIISQFLGTRQQKHFTKFSPLRTFSVLSKHITKAELVFPSSVTPKGQLHVNLANAPKSWLE